MQSCPVLRRVLTSVPGFGSGHTRVTHAHAKPCFQGLHMVETWAEVVS